MLEAARMRFRDTDLTRVQRDAEERCKSDPAEVCIPVAEGGQRVTRAQALKRGLNVCVWLQRVASGKEYLEGAMGHLFIVATVASMLGQRGDAQIREVMGIVRLAAGEPLARRTHILDRDLLGDPRAVLAQPIVQALLRANDHRTNIPQCIIEIEGDRAQIAEPGGAGSGAAKAQGSRRHAAKVTIPCRI